MRIEEKDFMEMVNQFKVQTTLINIMVEQCKELHVKWVKHGLSKTEALEFDALTKDLAKANEQIMESTETMVKVLDKKLDQDIEDRDQWIQAALIRFSNIGKYLKEKGLHEECLEWVKKIESEEEKPEGGE